jgi:hypothetical protein
LTGALLDATPRKSANRASTAQSDSGIRGRHLFHAWAMVVLCTAPPVRPAEPSVAQFNNRDATPYVLGQTF